MNIKVTLSSTKRHDGLAIARISYPGGRYDLHIGFRDLFRLFGNPDPIALDFLYIAGIAYVIDRSVPRSSAADNWTRTITVELPVSQFEDWEKARPEVVRALRFLSGDTWKISFRRARRQLFKRPLRRRKLSPPLVTTSFSAVCLFSGGLDSFIGTVNLLESSPADRILLVGHHDSRGPQSQQARLFAKIAPIYANRADWLHTRVGPAPQGAPEQSLRTRSLVFLALGLYAARAIGEDVALYAPENGTIAINVALTPSRSGSLTTRTMHPFFLQTLKNALNLAGIHNQIINPLEFLSKGQCVERCLNPALLRAIADDSVSCSHWSRRQHWTRKSARNCGYCVPCLFRRAALHHIGMDDGKRYGIDICRGELLVDDKLKSATDLRAVLDFIGHNYADSEVKRMIVSVANVDNLDARVAVVQRGFEELRKLVSDKGTREMRASIGLAH